MGKIGNPTVATIHRYRRAPGEASCISLAHWQMGTDWGLASYIAQFYYLAQYACFAETLTIQFGSCETSKTINSEVVQ